MTRSEKNSVLYNALVDECYTDEDDMAMKLGDLIGGSWREYDTKIDDGCMEDEEDEYVMVSCFESTRNEVVRIYYGDNTMIIGDVSYNN